MNRKRGAESCRRAGLLTAFACFSVEAGQKAGSPPGLAAPQGLMPRKIDLFIPGPAGRLEALLEEPEDAEPVEAALVCHPHPSHGGTMHNKVVYRIARGLRRAGAVVLRFNYRGVNLSEGVYDRGEGELEDARACLDYLRGRYPDLPFTLAGFSFGSRIALRIGCGGAGARRVIAVGIPYHLSGPRLSGRLHRAPNFRAKHSRRVRPAGSNSALRRIPA